MKIILLLICVLFSKEVVLDGTAAVIGKKLITVRDVYFYRAIHHFIKDGTVLLEPVESNDLLTDLHKIVLEEMLLKEMGENQNPILLPDEFEKKIKSLNNNWRKILNFFNRKNADAIELLLRNLKTEKFFKKRIEVLTPIITKRDIEFYYEQNKSKFSDFDKSVKEIEQLLISEKRKQAVETWINFLKGKYNVRELLQ